MITNKHQYLNVKLTVTGFHKSLAQLASVNKDMDLDLQHAMRAGIESEVQMLQDQILEYEAFCAGQVKELKINSLEELPNAFIRARIARRLTQKGLAIELGLKEQQIQRYEATHYQSANFARLVDVATALNIDVQIQIALTDNVKTLEDVKALDLDSDHVATSASLLTPSLDELDKADHELLGALQQPIVQPSFSIIDDILTNLNEAIRRHYSDITQAVKLSAPTIQKVFQDNNVAIAGIGLGMEGSFPQLQEWTMSGNLIH